VCDGVKKGFRRGKEKMDIVPIGEAKELKGEGKGGILPRDALGKAATQCGGFPGMTKKGREAAGKEIVMAGQSLSPQRKEKVGKKGERRTHFPIPVAWWGESTQARPRRHHLEEGKP